jgi:steroid 5-alpha reductase family enzyme
MESSPSDTEQVFTDFLYEMWVYQYPKCVLVLFIAWLVFLKSKCTLIIEICWVLNHFLIGLS